MRFTLSAIVRAKSLNRQGLPRLVRALLYCFQLVVLCKGVGMRLQRLMGVADQIIASGFSYIDLSNKAQFYLQTRTMNEHLFIKR